jgi:ABC-2 type transport system permease protein
MLRDIALVFGRESAQRLRQPAWLVMSLAQPLLFMFFFGPLLTKFVAYTPGFPPGDTWTIFAPALMVQMVLVSSSMVGLALLAEYRSGVLERLRVTPLNPASILLGKVLTVTVAVLIQSGVIVLVCHLAFGVEPPLIGLTLSLVIVALLASALASFSYGLALRIKNEEGVPAVLNATVMPILLLSGTFLPITAGLAPSWLYVLSRVNPIAHVMDAERATFRGDFSAHAILTGSISVVALAALALWFGTRSFARERS